MVIPKFFIIFSGIFGEYIEIHKNMETRSYTHYYKTIFFGLSLILLTKSTNGLGGRPRGLRPELITFYDPNASNGMFQCLDGSITIKYLQVNDDYCDCPVRIASIRLDAHKLKY
jgi:hypothetical protein